MSAIRRPDLSRLHSKATVKCECGLVQFQTGTTCRRCGVEFEEREEIELPPLPPPAPKVVSIIKVASFPTPARQGKQLSTLRMEEGARAKIDDQVATALWLIRVSHDLSQNDVAKRVGNYRSHVSRMEGAKCAPNLPTFFEYCGAFGITPYGLLVIAEAIQ